MTIANPARIFVLTACALLTSCVDSAPSPPPDGQDSGTSVDAQIATPEARPISSEEISTSSSRSLNLRSPVPPAYRLPGVDDVATYAESYPELLANIPSEDRAIADTFYRELMGESRQFSGTAQLKWMAERGFPFPEDIAAQNAFTTAELLEQARDGSVKSTFFYLYRMSEPDDRLTAEQRNEIQILIDSALMSGSPFAGYSLAHYNLRFENDLPAAMAAFNWSYMTGDARAALQMRRLESREAISPTDVLHYYASLQWQTFHRDQSLLDQRRFPRIPSRH